MKQFLGYELPDTILVPIEPYSALIARSGAVYEEAILKELETGEERVASTIIHEINADAFETFPIFEMNIAVPEISQNCTN